ncbi:hypothetical protein G6F46_014522 [Rhizopus delemar]|nr:hypothetical protein G6F46_014522 [Rhizopus delemar]
MALYAVFLGLLPLSKRPAHFVSQGVQRVAHALALGVDPLRHVLQVVHQLFAHTVQGGLALANLERQAGDRGAAFLRL